MEDIKVLYVDDDINMLNTGEEILVNAGFKVSLAKSGKQAVRLLEKGMKYDLILLDIDMPEMDGYETFSAIRAISGQEKTPIVFLTAMDAPDFEIKGLEMGAADYISKPFIKDILIARVRNQACKALASRTENKADRYDSAEYSKFEKSLTESELNVALLIADGLSNKEISDKTNYSYGYVKKVVSIILDKMYLKNRVEIRTRLKKK
ncbi:MAG: response regulator transcription factor [Lachnospiraceae bacterium]|nr:response regulator transcription factor [Lachnospiraceae bacterium]